MSDPSNTPADFMDELFDGIGAGDPLADEVEHLLNETGGPVPIDEAALQSAVRSAAARLDAQTRAPRWRWMAVAAATLLIPAMAWIAQPAPVAEVPIPIEVADPPATPGPGVSIAAATATVEGETLVLSSGAMSYRRDGAVQPHVHQVEIPALDLLLVPVGTVFSAGVDGDVAALHVTEGRVQILHDDRLVSEISAGSWAVATITDGELEVLQAEGRIESNRVAEDHRRAARALFAQLRWTALPEDAKTEIGK